MAIVVYEIKYKDKKKEEEVEEEGRKEMTRCSLEKI